MSPVVIQHTPIDEYCEGEKWEALDEDSLARLVAIIAMGQAKHAADILKELKPMAPSFTKESLINEAKVKLTVQEDYNNGEQRRGYPCIQRDGYIFEIISWIAASKLYGKNALLKPPHICATTQGLDGLMLELSEDKTQIKFTTVFEDKCTEDPRGTFISHVVPAFLERHQNKRDAELVDAATTLLAVARVDDCKLSEMAAAVTDRNSRKYRASFAVDRSYDAQEKRAALFKDFNRINGINKDHRIGGTFVHDGVLREWFNQFALKAINYLDSLNNVEAPNV